MADDVSAFASEDVIALWPDGPPDPIPDVGAERVFRMPTGGGGPETDWLRNVSKASLTVVRPHPDRANGTGVIVCPGGGWRILAWRHEGMAVAEWFAERGVTAFVLKYRVMATPDDPAAFDRLNQATIAREGQLGQVSGKAAPRTLKSLGLDENHTRAMAAGATDGRRALAVVRERAGHFGVAPDRIGMIGFSAGAFVTAEVAVRPDGPPLAYAAAIYGGETWGAPVPADAPPLFACIAQDDRLLARVVEGLYADWTSADRPAELHIFQKGGHGFGLVKQNRPSDHWPTLLEIWLKDLGCL